MGQCGMVTEGPLSPATPQYSTPCAVTTSALQVRATAASSGVDH